MNLRLAWVTQWDWFEPQAKHAGTDLPPSLSTIAASLRPGFRTPHFLFVLCFWFMRQHLTKRVQASLKMPASCLNHVLPPWLAQYQFCIQHVCEHLLNRLLEHRHWAAPMRHTSCQLDFSKGQSYNHFVCLFVFEVHLPDSMPVIFFWWHCSYKVSHILDFASWISTFSFIIIIGILFKYYYLRLEPWSDTEPTL